MEPLASVFVRQPTQIKPSTYRCPPVGLQVNADGASVYLVGDAGSTRGVILCYDIFGRGPEHGVPPIIVALAKHESSHYLLHCAATKTKCPAYT